MGRVEAYKRALAITKRLTELQRLHRWTLEQKAQAMLILSGPESLPITLHNVGMCHGPPVPSRVYSVTAFEPVFLGQGSTDLLDEYWELVTNKGIHG